MKGVEAGRICVKLRGRDAGSKCVIKKVIDHNFVEVASKSRKTASARRVNIAHLELLNEVIDASDENAIKKSLSR